MVGSPSDSPASDNENTTSVSSNEFLAVVPIKSTSCQNNVSEAIDHETTESLDQPTTTHNLRPRLRPVSYGETRFKEEVRLPNMERFHSSTTMESGLTSSQEQKRQ